MIKKRRQKKLFATTRKHDSLAVGKRLRMLRLFLEMSQDELATE